MLWLRESGRWHLYAWGGLLAWIQRAAPLEEPPQQWRRCHGLRGVPYTSLSPTGDMPSSGMVVTHTAIAPSDLSADTAGQSMSHSGLHARLAHSPEPQDTRAPRMHARGGTTPP